MYNMYMYVCNDSTMYYIYIYVLLLETDKTSLEEDEKGSLSTSQELVDEVKKKLSVVEELKITAGNILLISVCYVMNVCLYVI